MSSENGSQSEGKCFKYRGSILYMIRGIAYLQATWLAQSIEYSPWTREIPGLSPGLAACIFSLGHKFH